MRIPFLKSSTRLPLPLPLNIIRRYPPGHPPSIYLSLWEHWSPFSEDSNAQVDWEIVVKHLRWSPSIAHYRDEDRHDMWILHFVCALQPPLHVVEAVLKANPDAIFKKSLISEITPLMVACGRNASPEVIRRLVQGAEETIMVTNSDGYAAIHWACREDVSFGVVEELLRVRPEVANLHVDGDKVYTKDITPIDIVSKSSDGSLSPNQWEKITLILQAAHCGGIIDKGASTLHAALALQCQDVIVLGALGRENLQGIRQRDQYGNLPLHYAVQWRSSTEMLLARLLRAYPDAANRKDSSGRLPLHAALISGYKWFDEGGVKEIFDLNKTAIFKRDKEHQLYPFALAAAFSDLDAVFNLLRQSPQLIIPQ
jgi:hypothetical protein